VSGGEEQLGELLGVQSDHCLGQVLLELCHFRHYWRCGGTKDCELIEEGGNQ